MRKLFGRRNNGMLRIGVVAILLVIPLYPKFPFIRIPGSQVSLRLEDFLLLMVSGIWFLDAWVNWREFLSDKLNQAIILFWLVGLVSLVSSVYVTETVVVHIGLLHWVRRMEYMIAFFIGAAAVRSKKDLVFYVRCLLLVMTYVFIFGVGQKYFEWPVITTQNWEYAKGIALRYVKGGHLISTFAGHYDLATYLILILPIFMAILFGSRKAMMELGLFKNKWLSRGVMMSMILMGMWLLVNSASRISVVSFLGAGTLSLLLVKRFKLIPLFVILSVVFIGFSSNLMDRYMRIIKVTVERFVEVVEVEPAWAVDSSSIPQRRSAEIPEPTPIPIFEDRSTSIRFKVEWPRAIRAVKKNPLLGTGYSSVGLAVDGDYLRILGEVGILGFMAFALVVIRILIVVTGGLLLKEKDGLARAFLVGVTAAIPGVGLNMVFIDILEASKFAISYWLLLGMAVSTVKLLRNE